MSRKEQKAGSRRKVNSPLATVAIAKVAIVNERAYHYKVEPGLFF
jgi:hypothetical protein